MTDDSHEPEVNVQSVNGMTTIEVHAENAAKVVRSLLEAMSHTVEEAGRIYVEVQSEPDAPLFQVETTDQAGPRDLPIDSETIRNEGPFAVSSNDRDDAEPEPEVDAEGSDGFDGATISAQTAVHAVADYLRKNGESRVREIDTGIDDYTYGTVSSTLTTGKEGHLFKKLGEGYWDLTDWGHEQIGEIGDYEPGEDDE